MMMACFQHLRERRRLVATTIALSLPFLLPGAAAAASELLAPTPLILKDGRIANVSVHVLPFGAGGAELSSNTGRTLEGLTAEVATDCFLTAQVIGHVGAGEVEGGDTLGAHRLARSRADAVQASLIDRGLPAKSIASVWVWQFMVLEPRATLWVFRLIEGEDCEGKPLEGAPAAVVAAAEPAQPAVTQDPAPSPPAVAPTTVARAAAMPADDRPKDAAAAPASSPAPAAPNEAAERPRARPTVHAAAAPAARAPVMTQSVPAVAPVEASPGEAVQTEVAPSEAAAPVARVESAGVDARSGNSLGSLSITFANNSSYFPPGTRKQLESMVGKLPAGRYRVDLVASVSSAASVAGARDAEEAARYNQWLAHRRLDRVQSWFELNVKDKDLIIQPGFKSGDDSRGVLVRISAAQTS